MRRAWGVAKGGNMSDRELIKVGRYECITKGCIKHHQFCERRYVEGKPSPKCRTCKKQMRLYHLLRRRAPPSKESAA